MPPQPQAVLAPLTRAALFLTLTVDPGGEDTVRALLPDLAALRRAVGFRALDGGLTCVTGIGSAVWDRLFAGPRPAGLHPFTELDGPRHRAPATPGDLLLHIRAERPDLCFELASQITGRLAGAATVVDSVHGFRYFDDRDLMGFVDGTENPTGPAATAAVVVDDEDPDFAGGSYVVVQKYRHDLTAWNALPVERQERAVGRTKLTNIELDDDTMPADSHVALTTLPDADGRPQEILRANMAFGTFDADGGEFGTYFIGYSRTPGVTERMLRNMFLGDPPGSGHDRILDFSTAVTGALFFAPAADLLADPPPAPAAAAAPAPAAAVPAATAVPVGASATDGSLGIGSLRRAR
ncbi:Dyp-type peroxidase [Kitasatospora sp. NPDC004240]